MRKGPGREARLSFACHVTMENRDGLCVLFEVHPAVGARESQVAEEHAVELQGRGFRPKTNGSGNGYHTDEFVAGMRELGFVPHPVLKGGSKTLLVVCTAAHAASRKVRRRIEEIFGWTKTTVCVRKTRYRSIERTHAHCQYVIATWTLMRKAKPVMGRPPSLARA